MASDYARRGRPRGSGLDDRVQLRRIVELLEGDPNLRPTTAIKAIGVSDPSTIRRLRDKLKADQRGEPLYRGTGGAVPDRAPGMLEAGALSNSKPVGRSSGAAVSGGLLEACSAPVPGAPLSWCLQWYALGLSAVSSAVEAQTAIMDDLLSVPQVASALRQQLLLNEVAKALCSKRTDVRTTLH